MTVNPPLAPEAGTGDFARMPPDDGQQRRRTLCVGVGSPHGDDQVGWRMAEGIAARTLGGVVVRQALSPADLLHWIDDCDRLVICDACRGAGPIGSTHRWNWPCAAIEALPSPDSHAFGLAAVLKLAAGLGRLPAEVIVWAIEAAPPQPLDALSDRVAAALPDCIRRICSELRDA